MSGASSKTVKLLLAEDNPMVRDLVAKGLEPFCEVVIAPDGADALLKVIDEPPDVILCDYNMPGLNGRQLFEKLRGRESTRHIPFLFMASRTDIEERLRPLIDGAEDFIAKPFLLKDLVRSAKKVVDRLHLEKLHKAKDDRIRVILNAAPARPLRARACARNARLGCSRPLATPGRARRSTPRRHRVRTGRCFDLGDVERTASHSGNGRALVGHAVH